MVGDARVWATAARGSARRDLSSGVKRPLAYRIGETLHLTALALWSGALFGAGVAAAVAFPTMRSLEPTLGVYPAYTGDHWMLGAGRVAARVFLIADGVQLVAALAAVVGFALAAFAGPRRRSWTQFFRAALLGAALLLAAWHLLIQGPRMDGDLRAYWNAAAGGDNEAALRHQEAFSAQHPGASRTMGATFAATLAGLTLGAWSLAERRDGAGS